MLRVDTQEAELVTGTSIEGAGDAIQAGQQVLRAEPSLAVLGAAADGNVAVWEGGAAVLPHVDVDVVDTTGGGDAFTAALTLALMQGQTAVEAGRRASAAAALTVGHWAAVPSCVSRS